NRAIEFLLNNTANFPRPYEFARDDSRAAVKRLATIIAAETEPLKLAYALWLVPLVPNVSPELAAAIVKRLTEAQPESNQPIFGQLCRAAAHCGPAAKQAASILVAQLERLRELQLDQDATPFGE